MLSVLRCEVGHGSAHVAAHLAGAREGHLVDEALVHHLYEVLAGAVLANAGLLLALVCLGMFARKRTTILPSRSASAIVERGPYRFSRNPMYLSLVLAYAGLAGMLEAPWSLLLLPLPVATLQRVTIPHEEARLAAVLGEDYVRYRARVRRWI